MGPRLGEGWLTRLHDDPSQPLPLPPRAVLPTMPKPVPLHRPDPLHRDWLDFVRCFMQLGDLDQSEAQTSGARGATDLRLTALASEVHRKELLSEGQLASLLRLGRRELRQLLVHEACGVDAGAPKPS